MKKITISFPDEEMYKIDEILSFYKKQKWTKSKVFQEGLKLLYRQFKKEKLKSQAQKMRLEYQNNPELNVFSDLDSEKFY